jgi:hypothetical protein
MRRRLGRSQKTLWIAAAALAATVRPALAGSAGPLLVCPSPNNDGDGYGGYGWTTMTADLNAAANGAGGAVVTTADLSNTSALLGYDGIWVDVRQPGTGTLTSAEASALSAYIATGRRVVLIGGNANYASWNASILGLVGGTDAGTLATGTYSASAGNLPLTRGVGSAHANGGDAAAASAASTSLFVQRFATVWGPAQNVVVLLNTNVTSDNDLDPPVAGNATFATNLAAWAAGTLADDTCIWTATTGGSWQSGGSWLSGAMPAVADTVLFNEPATYTVTVGGPVTARSLDFSAGRPAVAFAAAGATLTVGSTVTVAVPLSLTGSAGITAGGFNVSSGGSLLVGSGVTVTTGSLSAVGPVTVSGRLVLAGTANRVTTLTIPTGGQVDLGTGDLVVTDGDASAINAEIATAFAGGLWDGTGITSSAAPDDTSHLTAVGVIANSVTGYTTFGGQPVTATDVLVRCTLYGDANLDGVVNAADYTRIDAGYADHLTGWSNGDFNYDGVVDGEDYALIDNAFNEQSPLATAAVATPAAQVLSLPEPAAPAALALAAGLLGRRRRRAVHWRLPARRAGPD